MDDKEDTVSDFWNEVTVRDGFSFDQETTEPEVIGFSEDEEFLSWLQERQDISWNEAAVQQMEENWRNGKS